MIDLNKKFLALGLGLLLFGILAKSAIIGGTCSSQSVQCGLQVNKILVYNDSARAQAFFPHSNGPAADWVKVLPETLTLSAGETGVFEVYTIATCYADPGRYFAGISITNGSTENISCTIDIEQGHFVGISIIPQQKTITQCMPAAYNIELDNQTIVPKQEKELVNLEVVGLPKEWYSLEASQLIVEKGKKETVKLTAFPPCDADLGDYDFLVKASLFNPNFVSTGSAALSITQGQGIQIKPTDAGFENFGKPFLACTEKENQYTFEIQNNGAQGDTLELSLMDAPAFAKLSETLIEIAAGEKTTVKLVLEKNSSDLKQYNIVLTAKSKKFVFEKSISFEAENRDCFDVTVQKLSGEENVCSEEKPVYKFQLKNGRETPISLQARVFGLPADLSVENFSLNPGETKELTATLDASAEGTPGSVKAKDVFVELVLDTSGSMDLPIGGRKKIEIAKGTVSYFVNNISPINLGLMVFGQSEQCSEPTTLVPLSRLDVTNVESKINSFRAIGDTPLAKSLENASKEFAPGKENYVILVSDGKESCNGGIDSAIGLLVNNGVKVYAIGFDIDTSGKKQLENIAQKTSGRYFDASNAQELVQVFGAITKELEIELPKESQKTFTLKLDSDYFSFEKDYTVNISECYNVVLSVPNISVCRQVQSQNSFTVANLGSKTQALSVKVSPSWASTLQEITIEPAKEKTFPIALSPKKDSSENALTITAKSGKVNVFDSGGILYLNDSACYGFGIVVEKEFEGRIGEGERRKIAFSNNGQAEMEISISSSQPWVYFEPQQVLVQKGGTGFVNYYITPPFDFLGETKEVLLTASNNFGLSLEKKLTLNVTGPWFGLVPANVSVKTQAANTQTENGENTLIVEFELKNESPQEIEINSIEAKGISATFGIESKKLAQGETTKVSMKTNIKDGEAVAAGGGAMKQELSIDTSEGMLSRTLEFEVAKGTTTEPAKEDGTETGLTGLLSFSNAQTILGLILIVIVGGLLIYHVISSGSGGKEGDESKAAEKKEVKAAEKLPKKSGAKKTFKAKKAKNSRTRE
mgnify:CR=1 FL=1